MAVADRATHARKAVAIALSSGRLEKPTRCERCDNKAELHGHHADYEQPLEVEWLCHWCHHAEHHPDIPRPLADRRKVRVQVNVTPELAVELQRAARARRMSKTELIESAVRAFIDAQSPLLSDNEHWRGANNSRKTHCKHGHPFDEGNTLRSKGARRCRACADTARAKLRSK
jgi:hypothetical protein